MEGLSSTQARWVFSSNITGPPGNSDALQVAGNVPDSIDGWGGQVVTATYSGGVGLGDAWEIDGPGAALPFANGRPLDSGSGLVE